MTQVTVNDPVKVVQKCVDGSGRVSIGTEHAGDEVEVIVAKKTDNSGAENTAETVEEAA